MEEGEDIDLRDYDIDDPGPDGIYEILQHEYSSNSYFRKRHNGKWYRASYGYSIEETRLETRIINLSAETYFDLKLVTDLNGVRLSKPLQARRVGDPSWQQLHNLHRQVQLRLL